MMTSRSFWCSLVLLGVFPLVTRGWMDVDQSRSLYSDAGRLHQEVLYTSCCCSLSSWGSVLGLCSGSPYCKQKTSVCLSMCICIKHLPRRSVKNSETETLTTYLVYLHYMEVKLCIWLLWRFCLCCKDFTVCCVLRLLTPVKLNLTSRLSCLFTWVSGHLGET